MNGSQKQHSLHTNMAAPCIYHLKCKSLCLYSVQKSFYSPAHSVVTLPPSLPPSFALSPFPLCVPHFLSLSLTSLSLMLGLNMKLIDYCWRGLTEVQPVLDSFSLLCLTPHMCSRCSDVPDKPTDLHGTKRLQGHSCLLKPLYCTFKKVEYYFEYIL